jgi:predicted amidophosphoribosyltransferase
MALKTCRDCGNEVSSAADTCPHCGRPLKRASQFLIGLLLSVGLIVAVIVFFLAFFGR